MTSVKRYVVAQVPLSGTWRHYLCGWHASRSDAHHVAVFLATRDRALTFDEQTALLLIDRLDERYHRVVQHYTEEV